MFIPNAGGGLHDWILDFTRREILSGKTQEQVQNRCWELTKYKGRPHSVLRKEIDDAIEGTCKWLEEHPGFGGYSAGIGERILRAWEYQDPHGNEGLKRPPAAKQWQAALDNSLIVGILRKPSAGKICPKEYFDIAELYAGFDFPLCIAKEVYQPRARRLTYWRNLECALCKLQWLVPNPCLRCGDGGDIKAYLNGSERLWVIVEFDSYCLEDQAKLLFWLDRGNAEWDLSLIVYSGGKSLHGWFSCVGKSEHREIVKFFREATSLGCDKMMRTSVQYTRLPLGINGKTKRRQEIVHWSDEAIEVHKQNLIQYRKNMR